MTAFKPDTLNNPRAAWYVIAAGVVAALHVGKLPPALPVLGQVLGVSLLQAGFLLSLVQLAGMTLGLVTGLAVQRVGLKRSMVAGLWVLALASALGAMTPGVYWLLATRVLEGLGFLWVVLPAPALVRRLVPPEKLGGMLGMWGAYMPLGASLALLAAPHVISLAAPQWGWRILWWLLAAMAGALAFLLAWRVPTDPPAALLDAARAGGRLLGATLRSRAAWLMAMAFAMYSGQWLAVVGFLPSIYAQAGVAGGWAGSLTALAAAVNIVGNVAAGRLLGRGVRPLALLGTGFLVMAGGAILAFSVLRISPVLQYVAILGFSMVGGLIPATLFSLAIRLAPSPDTVSTTVGWIQQWSALGQFAGPSAGGLGRCRGGRLAVDGPGCGGQLGLGPGAGAATPSFAFPACGGGRGNPPGKNINPELQTKGRNKAHRLMTCWHFSAVFFEFHGLRSGIAHGG